MIPQYTNRKEKIQIKNLSISSADCNDYINTGIYYLGSNLSNAPQDYIKLIVLGVNKSVGIGDVFQIAGGPSNGKMYCRDGNFKASEGKIIWGQWRCLTQNITTGTEYETGRIIEGKKEYAKRINCGNLSAGGIKQVSTTVNNVNYLKLEGMATNGTVYFPINNTRPISGTDAEGIGAYIINDTISIVNKSDRSTFIATITIYYTKK